MAIQPTMLRPAKPRPTWSVVVGLLLTLPALVLLVTSYVEPAYWTIRSSFERFTGQRLLTFEGARSAGFDNYDRAFDRGLGGALGYALGLATVPLVLVLLLSPALAWAAHRSGRPARWATSAALTIPLAAFAPLAVALAHRVDGTSARWAFWLGTFGVVVAVSVLAYLAAFRTTRNPWPGVIIAGLLLVLGVLAAALQEFTFSYVYDFGARGGSTTPAVLMGQTAMQFFDFGTGSAVSSVLLLPLFVFGLAATALIAVTGLRLQVAAEPAPAARRAPALVTWVVLLLAVLVATGFGLAPWLSHITDDAPPATPPTWANTWLPPLVSTLVGVTVAALAAFGISGLRPLGRHSEWLLLPFGLFLFVGIGPLALRAYAAGATAGRLDSFLGLIPPSRLAIPAMFLLALLFRGQAQRRENLLQEGRPASWWSVILPALPMLALAYLATWVVQAQNLIWPWISSTDRRLTAQLALLRGLEISSADRLPYGRLLPLWMLVVLLLVGIAAQLLYLNRVALQYGGPERDHPPRT